ncbi:MAG: hypothetical protein EP336_09535 [Rhodobacteraceae bacterium]|nr:MAG: hypothetical protein EP336_09535 [Paracoccaceae bacterium]
MNQSQIRKIVWLDSNTHAGWHDPDQQKYAPIRVISIGWLVAEDDESVTLSGSVVFGDDYQATDTMTIPKVCIVSDEFSVMMMWRDIKAREEPVRLRPGVVG